MNLTSKSRYALKVMLDLARHDSEDLVRRQDIVRREGIPAKYLDQILVKLRKHGLIISTRGRSGGFRIARPPAEITMWDIFHGVEDGIYPVACVDEFEDCQFTVSCVASEPWQLIFDTLKTQLNAMTLEHFESQYAKDSNMCPMAGIRECRPGREPLRGEA
ncbi:MAG: Rrf2 family transcriptional regulator [Pseudobacteriovorax sp.]|nr:Rrf2 family transcriptional regulator [Pseudobacteriovorax sp.]